jgi:hypothetical protein
MKTDDLIKAIAKDGTTHAAPIAMRMAAALAVGGIVSGGWFLLSLGVRLDIADALQTWRFVTKLAIVLVCVLAALRLATRLSRPDADERKILPVLAAPIALLTLAIGWELAMSPSATWPARAIGTNWRICLTYISFFSVAPLASVLVALRGGAPRSPALAGAAAGLLAGSLAATLYALHCFDDSPLFVALWYVPTLAAIAAAGAVIGSRVLRW